MFERLSPGAGNGRPTNVAFAPHTYRDATGLLPELWQSLRSLWNYHQDVYTFHTRGLNDATHVYQSNPAGWLLLNRPVGVDADLDIAPGTDGCDAPQDSTCLRQVLLLGTPVLWWGGVLALVYAVFAWVARRDWRFAIPVVGVAATWLPWLRYDDRPIFSYYAVATVPFLISQCVTGAWSAPDVCVKLALMAVFRVVVLLSVNANVGCGTAVS